jgi:L-cysteine desulfidase
LVLVELEQHQRVQQQPMDQIHRLAHLQQRVAGAVGVAMAAQMVVLADQAAAELLILEQLDRVMLAAIHQSKAKMVVLVAEHFPELAAVGIQAQEQIHQTQARAVVAVVERLIQ